ncbi:chaperonin 10-like protein [Colletotrichum godetiae]|uniref:alcohol dehydrogenase n=1 Tax=Colletotrichum godetiae TaxID=1209918 RepID=A0AAJ0ACT9_9PEZI|nr:chaperonin 10-like protein [Colletotrichum godetiae]KAK1671457.1 chaperonin 10-like protein [Colletotrichum godetiae]
MWLNYSLRLKRAYLGPKLNQEVQLIPVQHPGLGEFVVKIACTGICGSDVVFSLGPEDGLRGPNHIAGHEGIGHIVMSHDRSLLGKPVAARYLASYCRSCHYCTRNVPESCPKQTKFPRNHNGTFQQYMTAPYASLMPLPEFIFDETVGPRLGVYTTALCSGAAAFRALKAANPESGDVVIVSGVCGGIGHLAGMMARNVFGAKVIGIDLPWKVKALGSSAADVFDEFVAAPTNTKTAERTEFMERISDACREARRGADSLLVTSGEESAFEGLTDYVCDGGKLLTSFSVTKSRGNLAIPLTSMVKRSIRFQGLLTGGWDESYEVMEFIRDGKVKPMITEVCLEEVPSRMKAFGSCSNAGKLVVRID